MLASLLVGVGGEGTVSCALVPTALLLCVRSAEDDGSSSSAASELLDVLVVAGAVTVTAAT